MGEEGSSCHRGAGAETEQHSQNECQPPRAVKTSEKQEAQMMLTWQGAGSARDLSGIRNHRDSVEDSPWKRSCLGDGTSFCLCWKAIRTPVPKSLDLMGRGEETVTPPCPGIVATTRPNP